ncbi:MAG: competence/damage-inducible protein A [Candidatus Limnocylindrales bacterium]
MSADPSPRLRPILRAELLSIGTELTVGETRDTNASEVAASLTEAGVTVGRVTAIPDRLATVVDAFRGGLERADLVVSTGGLGPTPDDLTREAIAEVVGETPVVDAELEAWLRGMWARRRIPFPESNLKQAWLVPSATALPNPNGTAPGWFVSSPDGGVIVALPGPPREMRPMWHDHALPALRARGLGADVASRTFRLMGIGESQVAERLGEALLRRPNPEIATYARVEAVDVRVSARGDGTTAAGELVEVAAALVVEQLGAHIWATGATTWSAAIGARLAELGWQLAMTEIGTRGQVAALLGDVDWLVLDEIVADDPAPSYEDDAPAAGDAQRLADPAPLIELARSIRERAGTAIGLAVRARERGPDTTVSVAVVTPNDARTERRIAFLGGSLGRSRSALTTAAILLTTLRAIEVPGDGPKGDA